MKKYLIAALIMLAASIMVSCEGTYTVTSQPAPPMYARPVSPGTGYIWIDGDWVFRGGRYVWHEGYWDRRREGRNWEPGRWEQRDHGYYWKRGHWH